MPIELSLRNFIAIILLVLLIIIGMFLASSILGIEKDVLDRISASPGIIVEVKPSSSQIGTMFFVRAYFPDKRDEQDLMLKITSKKYSGPLYVYDDGKHFDGKANDGEYGGYFDSSSRPAGEYFIGEGDNKVNFFIYEPGCKRISGSMLSGNIDISIVPAGYDNYEDFEKDAKEIILGKKGLLNIEPFKSNKDKFNFYLVNTSKDFGCEIGCHKVSTLVCCNDNSVYEEASRCNSDSVILLLNSDNDCGSSSSYAKICSKSEINNLILIHEFGHSFGDLADEYVYSDYFGNYNIGKISNVNCDTSGCNKWKNITDGCYEGCTYSSLYRPSKENSIMLDLEYNFNEVCRDYIRQLIERHVAKKSIKGSDKPVLSKKSYFLNLDYQKGDIKYNSVFLKPVRSGFDLRKSDYSLKIVDDMDVVLYESNLYVPNKILPFNSSGGPVVFEEKEFPILLPYFEDAYMLSIYNKEDLIEEVNLGVLSDRCGNSICNPNENHLSCPQDCTVKDDFCETSSCDPDCPGKQNCEITQKFWSFAGIGLIVISAVLIISILFKKKK